MGHAPGALHNCQGGGWRGGGRRRPGRRAASAPRQTGTLVEDAASAGRARVGAVRQGIFTIREAEADCRASAVPSSPAVGVAAGCRRGAGCALSIRITSVGRTS
jgi:hypothetical protein